MAKADNIVDVSVNAAFALGSASQVIDPTPNFDLTGNFVLDDTTTPNANPNCDTCTQSATITSLPPSFVRLRTVSDWHSGTNSG